MTDTEEPRILATPASGLIDEPVSLVLRGFGARQVVTVRSRVTVPDGQGFAAAIVIVTDDAGTADLATTTPLNGSYLVADAGGLIWSLGPDDETSPVGLNTRFIDSGLQPYTVELTAEVDGVVVATGAWERLPTRPEVERHVVRGAGSSARCSFPRPTARTRSSSSCPAPTAASRNISPRCTPRTATGALALGYFAAGEPGLLPETLTEIPLEYFETALDWITDHPALDEQVLVANGTSRGGELVLLLGSRYPQITAVIAWVPSNYLQAAIQGAGATEERTSWTFGGEDLPYLRLTADGDLSAIGKGWSAPDALDQRAGALVGSIGHLRRVRNEPHPTGAEIPVERIEGPVLFISGRDDTLWPSATFSDWAVQRLEDSGFPYDVVHLAYENAGHTLGPPLAPATLNTLYWLQPGSDSAPFALNLGGTPPGVAAARTDLWPQVLAFLQKHTEQQLSP